MPTAVDKNPDEHELRIAFARLSCLSDDDIERHFPGRDGPWSNSTKALLNTHGTARLNLNENWASVPPDWSCPACWRKKHEIARLSGSGVLIANLDLHHDHLTDALRARLQQEVGPDWIVKIPEQSRHIVKRAETLVARFEPTLVCPDCNGADGAVKARLPQIDRKFSFRPSEIKSFIRSAPNREHQIDNDSACDIYDAQQEDFACRLALLDQFFTMMVTGSLSQERGSRRPVGAEDPVGIRHFVSHKILKLAPQTHHAIREDLEAFVRRSQSREGTASRSRAKTTAAERPSVEEVEAHDGSGAPVLWQQASGNWYCPCCDRTRQDIMRRSNKSRKQWSARLYKFSDFSFDDDDKEFDGDSGYQSSFIRQHCNTLICMDCFNVVPQLKQRLPSLSHGKVRLQIGDLRSVVSPTPNCKHEIDWENAKVIAEASGSLCELIDDYCSHYFDAMYCRELLDEFHRDLANPALAWRALRQRYIVRHGYDDTNVEDALKFLLAEAERLEGYGPPNP